MTYMRVISTSESVNADKPLHSGIVRDIWVNNYKAIYENSGYWSSSFFLSDTNLSQAMTLANTWYQVSSWIGIPVFLSKDYDGNWRNIIVHFSYKLSAAATVTIRWYLRTSPSAGSPDTTLGWPDDAYADFDGSSTSYTMGESAAITPTRAVRRRGSISGEAGYTLYMAWLFPLVQADTAGRTVFLRGYTIEEV